MLTENDYTSAYGVIELNDGYIINGHHYDRNFKYTGKNFNFSFNGVNTYSSCQITENISNLSGIERMRSIITRNNITYFIINNTQIYSYDSNTYEITKFYENTTTYRPCSIIDIDDTFLYIITKNSSHSYSTCLSKINLSTKAITAISTNTPIRYANNHGRFCVNIIKVTDNSIYFFEGIQGSAENVVSGIVSEKLYRFDKQAQTNTQLKQYRYYDGTVERGPEWIRGLNSFSLTNNASLIINGRDIKAYAKYVEHIDYLNQEGSNKDWGFQLSTDSPFCYWNVNNNIFVINYNQYMNATYSNLYKYNYETNESEILFNDPEHLIKTVLLSKDCKILLLNELRKSNILVYNEDLQIYEKKSEIVNINYIGIDSYNRIWYINNSNEIFCEDLEDPTEIDIQFERNLYTYVDTDIDTYLTFKAKTGIGTRAFGNYVLELSDNAYFKDNNSNSITIEYTDEPIDIDFVIINKGQIKCSVKYRKTWSR